MQCFGVVKQEKASAQRLRNNSPPIVGLHTGRAHALLD
jgi:hypothetical protein